MVSKTFSTQGKTTMVSYKLECAVCEYTENNVKRIETRIRNPFNGKILTYWNDTNNIDVSLGRRWYYIGYDFAKALEILYNNEV